VKFRCHDTHIKSHIERLVRGNSQTHRQHGDLISLYLFFQNKERGLKISYVITARLYEV
jgi:hypothetical protein